MFGNMKLGTKITVGFVSLVAIAVALGGLAIYSMKSVEGESIKLSEEYVPEVDLCNQVERNSLMTMYAMRGYGLSEEKRFYDAGMKSLAELDKWLGECEALAARAKSLTKLGPAVQKTKEAVQQYRDLVAHTVELNEAIAGNRQGLDAAAEKYMSNCAEFLAGQNAAFAKDLAERQKKISLVSQIVDLGSNVRVLNFKAQATGDAQMLQQAIDELGTVTNLTDELRTVTRDAEDIRRIDQTVQAAEQYGQAMKQFLVEFRKGDAASATELDRCRKLMDAGAGKYVANCTEFLAKQQEALTVDMTERNAKINIVNDIIDLGNATRVACFKSQAMRDPDVIRQANANFDAMTAKFEDLRKITRLDVDLRRIDNTVAAAHAYKKEMNALLTNWLELQDVARQRSEAADVVLAQAQDTAAAGMQGCEEIAANASTSLGLASTTMIVGLGIAVVVSIALAVLITRSITGPIHRIIAGLTSGSEQTASAAGQVSSASQSLAEGASEQAASVEETTASVEEMTSMINQNASSATEARTLSESAKTSADKGTEAMGRMSAAIDDIKKSSDETAKIIKTIDDIAFQTNLLALNAAVEAARAGEAGKGFAVVAEEVRNLAQRSAEAARNTSDLIEQSVKNAENGVNISQEVGGALGEIAEGAGKVNDLVSEIAAACSEQAQGIDQINQAVGQMDQVTQKNAANAEESASAAEELSAQAEELSNMVGELENMVGGNHGSGAKTAYRAAPPAGSNGPSKPASSKPQASRSATMPRKQAPAGSEEEETIPLDNDRELANF
jgi:methyl-accepting chemotaxis protein